MPLSINLSTSHNSPVTIYTIQDLTTGRDNQLYKRLKLIAFDNTVLFDSGLIGPADNDTFNVSIDSSWITTLAIVQVTVILDYVEFGSGGVTELQAAYALPMLANIKH